MRKVNHGKNIVEVDNVVFSYGKESVIDGISLDVHEGDFLGVVGPNGSGKTTLLKIILGLLRPASGSVRLFGVDAKDFKDWRKVGYVPQKVTNFDVNFPVNVFEVVEMGRLALGAFGRTMNDQDRTEVKIALEKVGMWEYRNRLIGDLSGGQQQRVMIARALVSHPQILFFDEPTSGIDVKAQEGFFQILHQLNDEGMTVFIISHDIDHVTKHADHIACVDRSLVCHVTPQAFVADSVYEKVFGHEVRHHHHQHGEDVNHEHR